MSSRPVAVVTGGAGFIGSHMVDLLLGRGYAVRVVDNLVGGRRENLAQHAKTADLVFEEKDIRAYAPDDALFKNAKYVFEGARDLADEVTFKSGGVIERRANDQLAKAVEQLEHVKEIGLFRALEDGEFADVKRDPQGGRGYDGVFKVSDDYFNPFFAALRDGRMSGAPTGPAAGAEGSTSGGGH